MKFRAAAKSLACTGRRRAADTDARLLPCSRMGPIAASWHSAFKSEALYNSVLCASFVSCSPASPPTLPTILCVLWSKHPENRFEKKVQRSFTRFSSLHCFQRTSQHCTVVLPMDRSKFGGGVTQGVVHSYWLKDRWLILDNMWGDFRCGSNTKEKGEQYTPFI